MAVLTPGGVQTDFDGAPVNRQMTQCSMGPIARCARRLAWTQSALLDGALLVFAEFSTETA